MDMVINELFDHLEMAINHTCHLLVLLAWGLFIYMSYKLATPINVMCMHKASSSTMSSIGAPLSVCGPLVTHHPMFAVIGPDPDPVTFLKTPILCHEEFTRVYVNCNWDRLTAIMPYVKESINASGGTNISMWLSNAPHNPHLTSCSFNYYVQDATQPIFVILQPTVGMKPDPVVFNLWPNEICKSISVMFRFNSVSPLVTLNLQTGMLAGPLGSYTGPFSTALNLVYPEFICPIHTPFLTTHL